MKIGVLIYDDLFLNNLHDDYTHIGKTPENIFRKSGKNLGNNVWAHSLIMMLGRENKYVSITNENKKECDIIVLCLANIIRCTEYNEKISHSLYEKIKDYDKPLIVLSIGAQHHNTLDIPSLGKNCKKLINFFDEKCKFIGVRGEFTKRVFINYGIDGNKIIVTGCPSIFLNKNPRLGKILEEKYKYYNKKGQYCYYLPGNNKKCNDELLKNFQKNKDNSKIILQSQIALTNDQNLSKYVHHFSYIPDWYKFLKTFDYCISPRIHGGLMAIMAEIPTTFIAIDGRVEEMCDTFKLPHISIKNYINNNFKIIFNGDDFDKNRVFLAKQYKKFFDYYNIKYSDYLNI